MPELPEVETARRLSETWLVGKTIASVDITLPKLLRDSPIVPADVLVGSTLVAARRRAKVLIFDFSNDLSLMIHLKLAGQWAIQLPDGTRYVAGHPHPKPDGEYPHKATHAIITFADGTLVYYSDIRQFGWWRILPTDDIGDALASFNYGPEATDDLDVAALAEKMMTRGIPVKGVLLDQSFVAGLGNIYADEVLWRARVHPATPANAISTVKRRDIVRHIGPVVEAGIAQGGAKIVNNVAQPIDGFPAVHAREGLPCPRCSTTIRKTRVVQRGTYYCPKCQKLPKAKAVLNK